MCWAVLVATLPALTGQVGLAGAAARTVSASSSVSASSGGPRGGHAIDPSLFEPGQCESFKPTAHNRHTTVFLDAGHGGIDPGGVGVTQSGLTIYEADETLPVELDAMALLRANGFGVVVSRTRASTVVRPQAGDLSGALFTEQGVRRDVGARDVCANMAKSAALIGIYFDAAASPLNAGSITGYDAVRPFAARNLRLATLVQADVLAAMNRHGWAIPNDGVVTDDVLGGPPLSSASADYGHLLLLGPADPGYFSTPSTMPGALIEPLYITDPYEGSIAAGTIGQRAIARGLATAVEQYVRSGRSYGTARRQ